MGAIGVVFHVNPNASEAEQPGNDRVPSLMIGGLTASLAGVDRAQPDGALERFKFPANPTLMGPVQPADTRHEEQVQTPISVELARDGEGVLVVRRLPRHGHMPSLKPRHGRELQQRQRRITPGAMDVAHGFRHHDRSRPVVAASTVSRWCRMWSSPAFEYKHACTRRLQDRTGRANHHAPAPPPSMPASTNL